MVRASYTTDTAYSRSDWLLAYLHRATAGGVRSIAGLHPVDFDCRIENVDVTHLVPGHLSYRALTPLLLGELGFKTTADYFDEPESLDSVPEREIVFDVGEETSQPQKKTMFADRLWRRTPKKPSPAPTPLAGDLSSTSSTPAELESPALREMKEAAISQEVSRNVEDMKQATSKESALKNAARNARMESEEAGDHVSESQRAGVGEAKAPRSETGSCDTFVHTSADPLVSESATTNPCGNTDEVAPSPAPVDSTAKAAPSPAPVELSAEAAPAPAPGNLTARAAPSASMDSADITKDQSPVHNAGAAGSQLDEASPTPQDTTPAYSTFGLSSDDAQQLARQFNDMAVTSDRPEKDPLSLPTPPGPTANTGRDTLPDWAADNPWN